MNVRVVFGGKKIFPIRKKFFLCESLHLCGCNLFLTVKQQSSRASDVGIGCSGILGIEAIEPLAYDKRLLRLKKIYGVVVQLV